MSKAQHAIVFVIDDEAGLREALQSLIRSVGLRGTTFASRKSLRVSSAGDFEN